MTKIITIAILCCLGVTALAQKNGTFTDNRDGTKYKTVKVDATTWFAENLRYKPQIGFWAYDDNEGNTDSCGYLYNWETAKTVCPAGWHLPTRSEWEKLIIYFNGDQTAGGKLKSANYKTINNGAPEKDSFVRCLCGYRSSVEEFSNKGKFSSWWTSDEWDENGWEVRIFKTGAGIYINNFSKQRAYPVRCIKD